ncbi:MAG: hypothetical protein JW814_03595 [Candidatus Krumholzibacteriota bacterium]|nr:hypothetical protein [Candidatus Krumholzibacteriota bacterium]
MIKINRLTLWKTAVSSALFLLCSFSFVKGSGIDLLIPGVSLESVSFDSDASVEYMIISEAYGVNDTSKVKLSVLGTDSCQILLEIVSSDFPEVAEENLTIRLYLDSGIVNARTAEEAGKCIGTVLLKKGTGAFEKPDDSEIDEFDLEKLFLKDGGEMEEKELGNEEVETPAGRFECSVREFARSEEHDIRLGGVDAVRFEEETSRLAVSGRVPFWGVVSSRVERRSFTRVRSADGRGRPPRPKITVTESRLIGFSIPDAK